MRFVLVVFAVLTAHSVAAASPPTESATLLASVGEADITPQLTPEKEVWLAGYMHGRAATGVHDPLFARALLLSDGTRKIAIVSLDLIGLSYPATRKIRESLPEIDYVMVCCTHNHEGPDTIGIWGENPLKRGVDDTYNARVEKEVVRLVQRLSATLQPVRAEYGQIDRADLVQDNRQPLVIDPTLRVLRLRAEQDGSNVCLLVQGTSHPEALGATNTQITADFPYFVQTYLRATYDCPSVYVSGAIGGLMAPPEAGIYDPKGTPLRPGNFAYAEAYGTEIAIAVGRALDSARPLELTPFAIHHRQVAIPIDNPLYRFARSVNVLRREGFEWLGSPHHWGRPISRDFRPLRAAAVTEVSLLRLGQLNVLGIPGELYPELVYGKVPDPAAPNADFPEAPAEPDVAGMVGDQPWILCGLANDEVGYIIPKRQWDRDPPYAYGRSFPQYGEINSCSPEVAPIIMQALAELCGETTGLSGS